MSEDARQARLRRRMVDADNSGIIMSDNPVMQIEMVDRTIIVESNDAEIDVVVDRNVDIASMAVNPLQQLPVVPSPGTYM